jgi:hypothetical protein
MKKKNVPPTKTKSLGGGVLSRHNTQIQNKR